MREENRKSKLIIPERNPHHKAILVIGADLDDKQKVEATVFALAKCVELGDISYLQVRGGNQDSYYLRAS